MIKPWPFIIMLLVGAIAMAQPAIGQAAQNRFIFEKTADGILRFDGDTGSIDICADKDGEITCKLSDDDRAGYEKEIARLKQQIADMQTAKDSTTSSLPSKKDMDQAFDTMKYFFDKFKNEFKAESPLE